MTGRAGEPYGPPPPGHYVRSLRRWAPPRFLRSGADWSHPIISRVVSYEPVAKQNDLLTWARL